MKIWSLIMPLIIALISSVTTISVALISHSSAPKAVESRMVLDNGSETVSPVPQLIQEHKSFSGWPIVLLIIFLCVFFAAKFIGTAFTKNRYEPAEIGEENKAEEV